ncbi:hypothetical protein SKTS_35150 [Sulfurimicrobium lacus]|uniref:Transmembrane protein n=2 Tax=Sulfurimicrobium lacus TaxID=2715678 RepID=A0A6F8VIT3_9PROT|nr:hypothetical protein SKTS_35150 [Sulfurimicrobium lacus]
MLIGLFLIFASIKSPEQSLVLLVGAAFFLGLAALSFWGRSEPHILFAFAVVFAVHLIWGLLTGEILELTRHAPRTILLSKEPEAFWSSVVAYCLFVLALVSAAAYLFWRQRHAQPSA